jgi:hypothetical protein
VTAKRARWVAALGPTLAGHLAVVLLVFHGVWLSGETFFFRDIATYYHPNEVFLSRAFQQGVWPLWNPACDAGAPFLISYPLELALVWLIGATGALAAGPCLHLFLAMTGMTVLSRRLGVGAWGAWLSGAAYGLSGFVLSSVNLFELFHGLTWAPWVAAALLHCWEKPSGRNAALLALVAALQVSTLSAEAILQTALLVAGLARGRPTRARLIALGGAGMLVVLLAAPILTGVAFLIEGTRRMGGLPSAEAFAFSLHPAALLDAVLPHFFGDVHTRTDHGFWGQAFFPAGFPYFVSLYVGLSTLMLAFRAGVWRRRLWLLFGLGVLLALGSHGPLGDLLSPLMRYLRTPAKFLLLATLALSLLAGRGLERAMAQAGRASRWLIVPGAALGLLGVLLAGWPSGALPLIGRLFPDTLTQRARPVVELAWPADFSLAGLFALGVGLMLVLGGRRAAVAGLLLVADLWTVNRTANVTAPRDFYELRPAVRALVDRGRVAGRDRWFSYGIEGTPSLRWNPRLVGNTDVWLYYLDRQSLLPRHHVLDGLDGAFDTDSVGWAPTGSTLSPAERSPAAFAAIHRRLRLANVRWVLSFTPLHSELVVPAGEAAIAQSLDPLRLYEIVDVLPRAFWVPRVEVVGDRRALAARLEDPAFDPRASVLLDQAPPEALPTGASDSGDRATVSWARPDPHTVRLTLDTPPGIVFMSEGFHPAWHAYSGSERVPLMRANGRYWALPTPGGRREVLVRFEPAWRLPALGALALGLAGAVVLLLSRIPRDRRATAGQG